MKIRVYVFSLFFATALFCAPQFAQAENFAGGDGWEELMEVSGLTPEQIQSILACMGPKPGGGMPSPDDVYWFFVYASLPVEGEQLPSPVDPRDDLNSCLKAIQQKQMENLSCVCEKIVSNIPVLDNIPATIDGDYARIGANICGDFVALPLKFKAVKYMAKCVLKAAEVIDGQDENKLPAPPPPLPPSSPRPPKKRNPIDGIEKGQKPKQVD